MGQLDLCAAAAEPVLTAYEPQPLKPKHPGLSSSTREASTVRSPGTATKRSPRSSQAEKVWKPSNEDPAAAKTKLKVIANKRQSQTATSQEEKLPPSWCKSIKSTVFYVDLFSELQTHQTATSYSPSVSPGQHFVKLNTLLQSEDCSPLTNNLSNLLKIYFREKTRLAQNDLIQSLQIPQNLLLSLAFWSS